MKVDKSGVTFNLQNTSAKAITAWHVRITLGDSNSGKGTDAYRSFAGLTRDRAHIVPGGTIAVAASIPSGTVATSSPPVVQPTCAVFEDRSFAGDATFADFIFKRRSAELAAWQQVFGELDKARAGGPVGLTTLEHVLSTMDASPQNDGADMVRQNARANLSLAIAAVRTEGASAASRLDGLLDRARRNLAAAMAHARP